MPTENLKAKLTKRYVDALRPAPAPPPGQRGGYIAWDTEIKGLGVSVLPSGHKAFVLYYRTIDGTQRKPTLGNYGVLTVETARDHARDLLADVRRGEDPSQERREVRAASTVNDACDRYMREHANIHKKPRSAKTDESNLKKHVRSRWGTRKIASITHNDVVAMHMAMAKTPGAANRVVALVSKLCNLCESWGLRPLNTNPCRHVRKYPENPIHNHTSEIELRRLAKVLRESEEAHARVEAGHPRDGDGDLAELPVAIAIIRLLILTGMRSGEVLGLKWSEVDYEGRVLRLADSKTGAKKVPLTVPVEVVLKAQKRIVGSPWVFPGRDRSKHFVGLPKIAKKLYKRAGLPKEFRPAHDWRHNFGTAGTGENLSLTLVGSLLGHKSPQTTKRYAQAADDPQRAAAEKIATKFAGTMATKPEST